MKNEKAILLIDFGYQLRHHPTAVNYYWLNNCWTSLESIEHFRIKFSIWPLESIKSRLAHDNKNYLHISQKFVEECSFECTLNIELIHAACVRNKHRSFIRFIVFVNNCCVASAELNGYYVIRVFWHPNNLYHQWINSVNMTMAIITYSHEKKKTHFSTKKNRFILKKLINQSNSWR